MLAGGFREALPPAIAKENWLPKQSKQIDSR